MRILNQEEVMSIAAGEAAGDVVLGDPVDDSGNPVYYPYDPLPPAVRLQRKLVQVQPTDDGSGCTVPPRRP
jgi:hypothetical protein